MSLFVNTPDSDNQLVRSALRAWTVFRLTCSLHRVHCSLHSVHCSLHRVHCSLHSVHCSLHSVHCSLHRVHCSLHRVHCSPHRVHCSLHRVHCSLHRVHCSLLPEQGNPLKFTLFRNIHSWICAARRLHARTSVTSYTSVNIYNFNSCLAHFNALWMEYIRSLRTGIMEEYPVMSTSQGTYVPIEQTSEAIRVTYEICRAGGREDWNWEPLPYSKTISAHPSVWPRRPSPGLNSLLLRRCVSPGSVHLRSGAVLQLDGDASGGRSQPVLLMHSGTEFARAVFTGGGGRHVRLSMRRSVRTLE